MKCYVFAPRPYYITRSVHYEYANYPRNSDAALEQRPLTQIPGNYDQMPNILYSQLFKQYRFNKTFEIYISKAQFPMGFRNVNGYINHKIVI